MSQSIREIPLNCAEDVQDIAEKIAKMKAGEKSEPVVLEDLSSNLKPRDALREHSTKGHPSQEQKIFEYKKLLWKKSPRHTSPPLQRGISNCRRIRALVMSRLPC